MSNTKKPPVQSNKKNNDVVKRGKKVYAPAIIHNWIDESCMEYVQFGGEPPFMVLVDMAHDHVLEMSRLDPPARFFVERSGKIVELKQRYDQESLVREIIQQRAQKLKQKQQQGTSPVCREDRKKPPPTSATRHQKDHSSERDDESQMSNPLKKQRPSTSNEPNVDEPGNQRNSAQKHHTTETRYNTYKTNINSSNPTKAKKPSVNEQVMFFWKDVKNASRNGNPRTLDDGTVVWQCGAVMDTNGILKLPDQTYHPTGGRYLGR